MPTKPRYWASSNRTSDDWAQQFRKNVDTGKVYNDDTDVFSCYDFQIYRCLPRVATGVQDFMSMTLH